MPSQKPQTLVTVKPSSAQSLPSFHPSTFFFWLYHTAYRLLVPQPGMEPRPLYGDHRVLTTGPPAKSIPQLLLRPPGPSLPPSSPIPIRTRWPPARVCSPTSHPSWAPRTQTRDTVCIQHLVLSAGTLTAPRGGQAQAAAAAVVHPAFVGAHCEGGPRVQGGRSRRAGWVVAEPGRRRIHRRRQKEGCGGWKMRRRRHGAGGAMGDMEGQIAVGASLLKSLKSQSLGSLGVPSPHPQEPRPPPRSHPVPVLVQGYLAAAGHHTCGSQRWGAARCAEGSRRGPRRLCPAPGGRRCRSGTQSRRGSCRGDRGQRRGSAQDPRTQSRNGEGVTQQLRQVGVPQGVLGVHCFVHSCPQPGRRCISRISPEAPEDGSLAHSEVPSPEPSSHSEGWAHASPLLIHIH